MAPFFAQTYVDFYPTTAVLAVLSRGRLWFGFVLFQATVYFMVSTFAFYLRFPNFLLYCCHYTFRFPVCFWRRSVTHISMSENTKQFAVDKAFALEWQTNSTFTTFCVPNMATSPCIVCITDLKVNDDMASTQ